MSDDESRPPLEPARPDAAESKGRPSYAPRLPWKWILLGIAGIGGLFATYYVRRGERQEALREQMVALLEQENVSELADRYLGFRRKIEGWVMQAGEAGAEGAPEEYVDPRLNISGLRSGEGLYLRVPADFANSPERIEGAALAMDRDAITRCLGLAPMSARGLYEKGYFLTPEYEERVREEPDMMDLRVLDDQLGRHVQVDAPVVASMLQADWFLLVVQRGDNRRDHPVDVYLWDLRRDQLLLRSRIQGRGLLIPVRMRFEGVNTPRAPGRPTVQSGGAADCSIASQIRELAGQEAIDFESGEAVIEAAAEAEAEAAAAVEAEIESEAEVEPESQAEVGTEPSTETGGVSTSAPEPEPTVVPE